MKRRQLFIEPVYIQMLFPDAIFRKAVGIRGRLAVIADHQVFKPLFDAGSGHLFDAVAAIAPVAVAVDDPFDIGRLNKWR